MITLRSLPFRINSATATVTLLLMMISIGLPPGIRAGEPSKQFIRDWLLCGPFPIFNKENKDIDVIQLPGMFVDFLAAAGGESKARPVAGQRVGFDAGECEWKAYSSPTDSIDLDNAVTKSNSVLAYAYCEILSDTDQACILALGSNDGVRAWLNGELVLEALGPRGLQIDHNLVPVALRTGRNSLLLKIEERGNRWAFACRFLPVTHENIAARLQLFDVGSSPDGGPFIHPKQSESLTSTLVKSARFEVTRVGAPEVLWQGAWTAGKKLPVQIDTRNFSQYLLQVRSVLAEAGEQVQVVPFTAGVRQEQVLFDRGISDYSIVLSEGASESEQWAASELRHWIKAVSGADLAIRGLESVGAHGKIIVVGWNSLTERLMGRDAKAPGPWDESFTWRSIGPSILIWGGRQRGTMYGVMSFLEREMGIRFYTPRATVTPKKQRYTFTFLNHSESPGVRVRNDFYYEAFDPLWAARNRVNGAMDNRKQPGGVESYWAVHTFYPLVPPEEFFASHPEYYSLIDGQRTHDRAQLCLSNPDVLRIVTERIVQKMKELPDYLIYDVSQNDWENPCQCSNCQEIVSREGSESGPVIEFVNKVADAVKPLYPDKFIGTLAYMYTRKPPLHIRPRQNVVVRFCSIECCFAHDFVSCPENAAFVRDMQGWSSIAPHIYIWDYVVNFSHYLMPFPNFRVLQPNIQFFRDHKAIGIMEQAAYQSRGGEFAELRAYLISKLLWNPEAEVNPIINDFMYGYYGRAGQFVREYFDLLHSRLTPETHIRLGLQHDDKLFSDEFVREAEAIFDNAEAVADSEEIRLRVDMARLPVLYLKCKRTPGLAVRDGSYARFCEITQRENVTHYAEAGEAHRKAFHQVVQQAK